MILLPLKKLNEIFHPMVGLMFDDAKKRIVAHRGVRDPTVEVDTMMILMTILLEERIENVSQFSRYSWQSTYTEQEIVVEIIHPPVSRARLHPDENLNAGNH